MRGNPEVTIKKKSISTQPDVGTIKHALNVAGILIGELYTLETHRVAGIEHMSPILSSIFDLDRLDFELYKYDEYGFIKGYYHFDRKADEVKIITQQSNFDGRVFIAVNNQLGKFINSDILLTEINPDVVEAVNSELRNKICQLSKFQQ